MARPRNDAVLDRMRDLAERLFSERGLDAVSLREISAGAGSGNSTAVQYHFGDAAGLIRAILEARMPAIDRERTQILAELENARMTNDIPSLMRAMFVPLINQRDEHGERRHAKFVLALLNSKQAHVWGATFHELQPSANKTLTLLMAATDGGLALTLERLRLIAIMVLTSVFNRLPQLSREEWDDALIANALAMASSAISAPGGREPFRLAAASAIDEWSLPSVNY